MAAWDDMLTGFDVEAHRSNFLDAWEDVSKNTISSSMDIRARRMTATLTYEAFVEGNEAKMRSAAKSLSEYLPKNIACETFLSDCFCVFLETYSKYLLKSNRRWGSVKRFVIAVERFLIAVSKLQLKSSEKVLSGASVAPDDDAITALEELRKQKKSIQALNTYQGVPIEFPASVMHTMPNKILLHVHPLQHTAATLQRGIYLLGGESLEFDLYARIKPVIVEGKDYLELRQFDKLSSGIHKRQTIRVKPELKTMVRVNGKQVALFDISIGGVATISAHNLQINIGHEVRLEVNDSLLGIHSNFSGEIVQISRFENGYKYHLQLELSSSQEAEISRYVADRQQKIVSNLKQKMI